jgi:hypothetical protein
MALTTAQLTALKNDIAVDPVLSLKPNTSDGAFDIAAAYNALADPDFWVWRTNVTKSELTNSTGPDGTTFTWAGNGFITRSAGEQAAWGELFASGSIDASKANVRQAFVDIFSGTGNAAANRTHLNAVARRKASRLEKLFATGTGSTASPAVMGYEGTVSGDDVQAARSLP